MEESSLIDMLRVIDWRLQALGMSDREASLKATGKPDAIREMRRGKRPSDQRLRQIARVLKTSLENIVSANADGMVEQDMVRLFDRGGSESDQLKAQGVVGLPRDVPVYAPIRMHFTETIGAHVISFATPVKLACRPPVIAHRADVFCVLMPDTTMEPRFDLGDELYIDPVRSPTVRDHVIVRLRNLEEAPPTHWYILVGRLLKLDADSLTLGRYYDGEEQTVSAGEVLSISRIFPYPELLSY